MNQLSLVDRLFLTARIKQFEAGILRVEQHIRAVSIDPAKAAPVIDELHRTRDLVLTTVRHLLD